MTRVSGGVTAPRGFLASGIASGIKRGKPDLSLIYSEHRSAAAGTLTTNRLAAAPILLARSTLKRGYAQAIVANSGNANCCTGRRGMQDAKAIRQSAADLLNLKPSEVLVASTGVIGRYLPLRKILKGLPRLKGRLNRNGWKSAAQAILTTDLQMKSVAVRIKVGGRFVSIGGMAKGSGMIDPAMATMLCFLTTDAAVAPAAVRLALQQAVRYSFNAISVDGQMSTNDMTLLLANGCAGNRPLRPGTSGWWSFTQALNEVTLELAKRIVIDGEGAEHFVTISVTGAATEAEAFRAAKAIANAPLVKTMTAGCDPNWGRVAATVGALGIPVKPSQLTIALSGVTVFHHGAPAFFNRLELKERFRGPELLIDIALGRGRASARVYTCDLTEEYVRINTKYS